MTDNEKIARLQAIIQSRDETIGLLRKEKGDDREIIRDLLTRIGELTNHETG